MDLRAKAAGFFLCNENLKEAVEILDNASDISDTIPDEIIVCASYEYEPIENIVAYIDDLESVLQSVWDEAKSKIETKGFILESESETIAVIVQKEDFHEFYKTVRLAIAEHYCCENVDNVSMNNIKGGFSHSTPIITFTADTIEDGEDSIRDYTLTQICIYN